MAQEEPKVVQEFSARIRDYIPGFEIRYKDESWSSKVLGILVWVFNREYMTHYTTTRYPRVYFPTRAFVNEDRRRAFKILAHEFVHLWDTKKQGLWHNIAYGLPQLLCIPFLIWFIGSWFVPVDWLKWSMVGISAGAFIAFACPLPAYFRMKSEIRGYTMNLCVNRWRHGGVPSTQTLDWIARAFTGPGYYYMWRDKDDVITRLHRLYNKIIEHDKMDTPYRVTKEFLDTHSL
jgi:hypothetical protein